MVLNKISYSKSTSNRQKNLHKKFGLNDKKFHTPERRARQIKNMKQNYKSTTIIQKKGNEKNQKKKVTRNQPKPKLLKKLVFNQARIYLRYQSLEDEKKIDTQSQKNIENKNLNNRKNDNKIQNIKNRIINKRKNKFDSKINRNAKNTSRIQKQKNNAISKEKKNDDVKKIESDIKIKKLEENIEKNEKDSIDPLNISDGILNKVFKPKLEDIIEKKLNSIETVKDLIKSKRENTEIKPEKKVLANIRNKKNNSKLYNKNTNNSKKESIDSSIVSSKKSLTRSSVNNLKKFKPNIKSITESLIIKNNSLISSSKNVDKRPRIYTKRNKKINESGLNGSKLHSNYESEKLSNRYSTLQNQANILISNKSILSAKSKTSNCNTKNQKIQKKKSKKVLKNESKANLKNTTNKNLYSQEDKKKNAKNEIGKHKEKYNNRKKRDFRSKFVKNKKKDVNSIPKNINRNNTNDIEFKKSSKSNSIKRKSKEISPNKKITSKSTIERLKKKTQVYHLNKKSIEEEILNNIFDNVPIIDKSKDKTKKTKKLSPKVINLEPKKIKKIKKAFTPEIKKNEVVYMSLTARQKINNDEKEDSKSSKNSTPPESKSRIPLTFRKHSIFRQFEKTTSTLNQIEPSCQTYFDLRKTSTQIKIKEISNVQH